MGVSVEKILAANDIGVTGAHQAGILVPRDEELLRFFPQLQTGTFNPDASITCIDEDGNPWEMRYVYYNGTCFQPPRSTRNEYRITCMTRFFAKWGAEVGDAVVFSLTDKANTYLIRIRRKTTPQVGAQRPAASKAIPLRGWRIVF